MCGFLVLADNKRDIERSLVEKITHTLSHRGPDGHGYLHSKNLLMWHNLLAIESTPIDGKQPLISTDNKLVAVVNGELYPYAILRKKMQSLGYTFKTHSDSELVLALYQHYGMHFVEHLRGEFSLVLWDKTQHKIIAVRDRFGIKPLVYGQQNDRLYIGSEAKALFASGFNASWSLSGLQQSFSHQYLLPDSSLFEGIKQLPPGHLLVFKNNKISIKQYWQVTFNSPQQDESCLLERLTEAVKIRIPHRKPVAFTLSGGLDSSAILKIASQFINRPIDCYSVSFEGYGYDEYSQAKQFAEENRFNIHQVKVSNYDLINNIDEAAYYSEGLAINGQYTGKYLLNKAVHQDGHSVVMSGEGADEAFMGYAHIHYDYLQHEKQDIALLEQLQQQYPLQLNLMLPDQQKQSPFPSFLLAKIAFCQEIHPLLKMDFLTHVNNYTMNFNELSDNHLSPSQNANQLWIKLALGNYILKTLGDGMEMAFSIEGRLPFLDHYLFDFATNTDTQKKLYKTTSKYLLRKALKDTLPDYLCQRPKHPFIAPPLALGLNVKSKKLIHERISRLKNDDVFDYKKVLNWFNIWANSSIQNQKKMDPVLMMLLSFSALKENFNLNSVG